MAINSPFRKTPAADVPDSSEPAFPATRTRPPQTAGMERFEPADDTVDLTAIPVIGPLLSRLLKKRHYQFSLILPNQIIFWFVIFIGIFGILDPTKNFGTAITWYLWFTVIIVATTLVGRAWCLACPFGGLGDWIQRHTFFKRTQKPLGLGLKMPDRVAQLGLVISAFVFILMTWLEEFFNIAGPGAPILTSIMVLSICTFAVASFLVFEKRTFCRYLCPLSSLIGTCGATGMVAGFRTRDREKCANCPTKECMRGGKEGFGCPVYVYGATSDNNSHCILCSECYKACPYDNLGMMVQKPLTSVIAPEKRQEIGWTVALLFGLVVFQQWNATSSYQAIDGWLNKAMNFPNYPNPVDYVGAIAAAVGLFALIALLMAKGLALPEKAARAFKNWFAPLMYGMIPLMGMDYAARVMPKFLNNVPKIIPAITGLFGSTAGSGLADVHLLPAAWVMNVQYILVAIGTLATLYAVNKIARKDIDKLSKNPALVHAIISIMVVVIGVGMIALYFAINGAE